MQAAGNVDGNLSLKGMDYDKKDDDYNRSGTKRSEDVMEPYYIFKKLSSGEKIVLVNYCDWDSILQNHCTTSAQIMHKDRMFTIESCESIIPYVSSWFRVMWHGEIIFECENENMIGYKDFNTLKSAKKYCKDQDGDNFVYYILHGNTLMPYISSLDE